MEDWVSMKHLVFCSGYNVPTLFLNLQKMSLVCRDRALSMTVSKQFTLYGPRPCLQYYNMTTSHPSATRGQAEQLCAFVP